MRKKKTALLTAFLAVMLSAAIIVGASFALFGTQKTSEVTVSTGNLEATVAFKITGASSMGVDAAADENDAIKFTDSTAGFALGGTAVITAQDNAPMLVMEKVAPGDMVEVQLVITNTTNSTIAIRYQWSMAMDAEDLGSYFVCTPSAESPAAGALSDEMLAVGESAVVTLTVGLDEEAGNEYMSKSGKVSFVIDLVQGNATEIPEVGAGA